MKFKRWFLSIILFLNFSLALGAKIRINEVMPINLETIDEEYEFPESWLELYNEGEVDTLLLHHKIKISTEDEVHIIKRDFSLKVISAILISVMLYSPLLFN